MQQTSEHPWCEDAFRNNRTASISGNTSRTKMGEGWGGRRAVRSMEHLLCSAHCVLCRPCNPSTDRVVYLVRYTPESLEVEGSNPAGRGCFSAHAQYLTRKFCRGWVFLIFKDQWMILGYHGKFMPRNPPHTEDVWSQFFTVDFSNSAECLTEAYHAW